jgi:hypothetical protein
MTEVFVNFAAFGIRWWSPLQDARFNNGITSPNSFKDNYFKEKNPMVIVHFALMALHFALIGVDLARMEGD